MGVRDRAVGASSRARARALTPAEAAWIAAVPCALLVLAAIVVLAPTLSGALAPSSTDVFWPGMANQIVPEPTEHAQYLLALGAPVLLAAWVVGARLRFLRLPPLATRVLVASSQTSLAVFLAISLVVQHRLTYGLAYWSPVPVHHVYFTWPTIAAAVALALALATAVRSDRLRAAFGRETRRRRVVAVVVAVLFTAVWLLTAINTDAAVGRANPTVRDLLPWSLDETFAILNGRTPLLNFHAQYGQLWPYVVAAVMAVLGTSIAVYTITMASIGGLALVSVFAVLRRVAGSSLVALGLYLPFVATGFFMERGPLEDRYGPANLFTIFPVRYAGPYLLAWLLMRHLDRRSPRRMWVLFLAGGLVLVNNIEFGVPAVAATIVTCIWARPPRTRRAIAQLLGSAVVGVAGACALVALLTLVRTGSLPDFGLLVEFSRLYAVSGLAMLPMPKVGFHLAVYVTFVTAIGVATVRAVNESEDAVLTGLLAWSGVFGLGVSSYFVGRSHPEVLIDIFSIWSFTLALLAIVVVRALAARPSRLPTAAELAALVGFGLAICSLAQTPTPWSQIQRLGDTTSIPVYRANALERFVAADTRRGERVAILNPLGHRVAYDLGLVNVSPYASIESIFTERQLQETLRALAAEAGTKVFATTVRAPEEDIFPQLRAAGFSLTRSDRENALMEFVDVTSEP